MTAQSILRTAIPVIGLLLADTALAEIPWNAKVVQVANGSSPAHPHDCAFDADFTNEHFYPGCDWNWNSQGRCRAVLFEPGQGGPTVPEVLPLTTGFTQSQAYGVRGRSIAGTQYDSRWKACLWRIGYAPGFTKTVFNLHTNAQWFKSYASGSCFQFSGPGRELVCGAVQTVNGRDIPYLWELTQGGGPVTSAPLSLPAPYTTGSCAAMDMNNIVGYVATAVGAAPKAALWRCEPGHAFLNLDHGWGASTATDTFMWYTVGAYGTWSGGRITNPRAVFWVWHGAHYDLHDPSTYQWTYASGLNGNAVVGYGQRLNDTRTRAIYWATPFARPGSPGSFASMELPMPRRANGAEYTHCRATRITAGGNVVVGVAYDQANQSDEVPVVWELHP